MLTIYAPSNQNSKAWEVFNGVKSSWPEQVEFLNNAVETEPKSNSMFWGFVGNNQQMVKKLEARKHPFWFTDTPYFGRFDKFNISLKAPDLQGDYVLVCPSSAGINQYLDRPKWLYETIDQIKRYTDRPIRIRHKPRGRGTSGPSEAKVPIEDELKNAWCCVTSCSISAIEAICAGKPVFCDEKSFATHIANTNLADIENPLYVSPEDWLYSLAYQQFTPEEFANGIAVEILMDKGIL